MQMENSKYTPGYVWITLGWYHDQWWTEHVSQDYITNCTDESLEPLVNRAIGIQQENFAQDENAPTSVNLVKGVDW
jgi:hypothetical protein